MKVYYVCLKGVDIADVDKYIHLIPPERQERTMRYRKGRDRLRSLAAGLLIQLAGNRRIAISEHGKPYFADGGVHFSLSHTGACAAIAFCDSEVGLDVEELSRKVDFRLTNRIHPNESDYIVNAKDPKAAFIEIWTKIEAYVKYTGSGIGVDLSGFDVTSPPISDMMRAYSANGYYLSVCCDSNEEMELHQISFEELLDKARALHSK